MIEFYRLIYQEVEENQS